MSRIALLVATLCLTSVSIAQERKQPPAVQIPRINSYEQLAQSLTKAGVRFERDPENQRFKVASTIAGQEGWAEMLWRKDKGVCQLVQSLGFRVPTDKVSAVESAIARVNHIMSMPGFYYNHGSDIIYCQHVLVLRPEDEGIPEFVLQQAFRQLRKNVELFRPAFRKVAAGELAPEQVLPSMSQPDSTEQARKLLAAFVAPGVDLPALSRQLRPQVGDFDKVFKPEFAKKAAAAYMPAWDASRIVVSPKPGQTTVRVFKATTEELIAAAGGNDFPFPGGYREILQHLQPGVTWHRFKFTEPEDTLGMAYDGLVQIDGRWVLFPKPWRVVE